MFYIIRKRLSSVNKKKKKKTNYYYPYSFFVHLIQRNFVWIKRFSYTNFRPQIIRESCIYRMNTPYSKEIPLSTIVLPPYPNKKTDEKRLPFYICRKRNYFPANLIFQRFFCSWLRRVPREYPHLSNRFRTYCTYCHPTLMNFQKGERKKDRETVEEKREIYYPPIFMYIHCCYIVSW